MTCTGYNTLISHFATLHIHMPYTALVKHATLIPQQLQELVQEQAQGRVQAQALQMGQGREHVGRLLLQVLLQGEVQPPGVWHPGHQRQGRHQGLQQPQLQGQPKWQQGQQVKGMRS